MAQSPGPLNQQEAMVGLGGDDVHPGAPVARKQVGRNLKDDSRKVRTGAQAPI